MWVGSPRATRVVVRGARYQQTKRRPLFETHFSDYIRTSSVRLSPRLHCGHGSQFWQKALGEAERELDAATTRSALDAAATKLMRAKAELI